MHFGMLGHPDLSGVIQNCTSSTLRGVRRSPKPVAMAPDARRFAARPVANASCRSIRMPVHVAVFAAGRRERGFPFLAVAPIVRSSG